MTKITIPTSIEKVSRTRVSARPLSRRGCQSDGSLEVTVSLSCRRPSWISFPGYDEDWGISSVFKEGDLLWKGKQSKSGGGDTGSGDSGRVFTG
jgi:hypothetical protein